MKTRLAKITIAMLALVMSVNVNAVDNSIYIDQTGDNAIISITQDGAGNRVNGITASGNAGQSTDAAKIAGDGNLVTINQVGSGNRLSLGVDRGTSTTTAATSINYSVTGNNATGFIDLNNSCSASAAGNQVNIVQSGDNANARLVMTGDGNVLNVATSGGANNSFTGTVTGNTNTQNISVNTGGGNTVATSQTGDNNTLSIASSGATNSFTVNQADGGHTASINSAGSGNQFVVNQSGTAGANLVNINVVGSGSQITTTQMNR